MGSEVGRQSDGTILVVDDHALVRLGLVQAFDRTPEFDVVGQAGSLDEARWAVEHLLPAVVVTDIRLPDGSGLDLVRELREGHEGMGIVVVSMYGGDDYLWQAMEAGASAFVSKEAPAEQVVSAARHALVAPLSFTADNLLAAMQGRVNKARISLSPREDQILHLLADGLGVSAIARKLFVSESTAKTHIGKIYEKLGAANRAQAIMSAVRAGLLSVD